MDLQATLAGSFTLARLIRRTALTTGSVLPAGAAPGESAVPWGRAIPGELRAGEPGRPPRHNARRSRQLCYTPGTEPSAVLRVWGKGETADFKCLTLSALSPARSRAFLWAPASAI